MLRLKHTGAVRARKSRARLGALFNPITRPSNYLSAILMFNESFRKGQNAAEKKCFHLAEVRPCSARPVNPLPVDAFLVRFAVIGHVCATDRWATAFQIVHLKYTRFKVRLSLPACTVPLVSLRTHVWGYHAVDAHLVKCLLHENLVERRNIYASVFYSRIYIFVERSDDPSLLAYCRPPWNIVNSFYTKLFHSNGRNEI